MTEETTINIETTLAHQEQQIAELNAVMTDQWKEIERLKSRLDKALAKIERLEYSEQGDEGGEAMSSIERARQDIPPHY